MAVSWALIAFVVRPFEDFPFVDDWGYAWSVERLMKTGELRILDWSNNPNPVQILWGILYCLPFGFSFSALRLSTSILAISGLCAFYLLLRELEIGRRDAFVGTATLAVNPVFFMLSSSFMTDIPFLSVMLLATFAMVYALRRGSTVGFAVATALGCLSLGIRLIGVAIPAAIVGSLVLAGSLVERRREILAVTTISLLCFVGLLGWTFSHTQQMADLTLVVDSPANRVGNLRYAVSFFPEFSFREIVAVTGFLGVSLLPLTAASIRFRQIATVGLASGILAACFAVAYAVGEPLILPLSSGATWALRELGATAALIPDGVPSTPPWWVASILSATATVSFAVFIARFATLRRPNASDLFIASLAGLHLLLIGVLWLTYDRYLLVLLPLAIALLLRTNPHVRMAPAASLLVVFAVISFVGLRDQISYNRAVWRGVDVLRTLGARDSEIDGGYMVNGWLQYAHPEHAPRDEHGNAVVPWINGRSSLRYRISNQPLPGWKVLRAISYGRRLAPSGTMYVLESPGAPVD